MASRFEIPDARFHRFDQARAKLSDGLVGLVLPRAQASGWHSAHEASDVWSATSPLTNITYAKRDSSGEATSALLSRTETQAMGGSKKRSQYDKNESDYGVFSATPRVRSTHSSQHQDIEDPKSKLVKSEIRREQCRTNQARYRNKQRSMQLQLEASVSQLRQELVRLKRQRQNLLFSEKTDQSHWTIVAEVFRILEKSFRTPWNLENVEDMQNDIETRRSVAFLQTAFTSNVAVGNVRGIDALVEQWRHYSLQFGDSRLQLRRVEEVSPCVMTAHARLHLTISELVLRHAFPHLSGTEPTSKYDVCPSLRERLLGKHLDCSISVDFLFDEESDRVERLEPRIDLMPALLRVLGNMEDVAEVCYVDLSTD